MYPCVPSLSTHTCGITFTFFHSVYFLFIHSLTNTQNTLIRTLFPFIFNQNYKQTTFFMLTNTQNKPKQMSFFTSIQINIFLLSRCCCCSCWWCCFGPNQFEFIFLSLSLSTHIFLSRLNLSCCAARLFTV